MEKAKILAIGKEIKENVVNGTVYKEREVIFGWLRDGYEGYCPRVRSGMSKAGKPYGMANTTVNADAFGSYVPKVGDLVTVSYNQYGRVVSVTKAAD